MDPAIQQTSLNLGVDSVPSEKISPGQIEHAREAAIDAKYLSYETKLFQLYIADLQTKSLRLSLLSKELYHEVVRYCVYNRWTDENAKLDTILLSQEAEIVAFEYLLGKATLITVTVTGTMTEWDFTTGDRIRSIETGCEQVLSMAIKRGIIILLARDRIAKFRQDAFTAVGIYSLHPQHEPSLDPQGLVGPLQVLMGDNRTYVIYETGFFALDTRHMRRIGNVDPSPALFGTDAVTQCVALAEGHLFICCKPDAGTTTVNVYDALSLELKRKVPVPGRVLSIESLSSSAPLAVVTNDAGDVSVYNLRTGALHAELPTVKGCSAAVLHRNLCLSLHGTSLKLTPFPSSDKSRSRILPVPNEMQPKDMLLIHTDKAICRLQPSGTLALWVLT